MTTVDDRLAKLEQAYATVARDHAALRSEHARVSEQLALQGQRLVSIEGTLQAMAGQLAELVKLSERQIHQREGLERAFRAIGAQTEKVDQLRQQMTAITVHGLPERTSLLEGQIKELQGLGNTARGLGSSALQIAVRWISAAGIGAITTLVAVYLKNGA